VDDLPSGGRATATGVRAHRLRCCSSRGSGTGRDLIVTHRRRFGNYLN
jgi:hypothetical protein